jgi:hypothetical protein
LMRFWNDLSTMSLLRNLRRRLRDFSCIMWLPPPLPRRTRPLPVTRKRFAAARLVFILGTMGSFAAFSKAAASGGDSEPWRDGGETIYGDFVRCQGRAF